MTEVPEHLLERSREARARLTGEGGDAPAPAAGEDSGDATPAVVEDTPAVPAEIEPIEVVPEPVSPMVAAAEARPKIPMWVLPILVVLPIWGFFYAGSLERPPAAGGLLVEGPEVYEGQGCAGCHGGAGGGGTGRTLSGGEVIATFPDPLGQIWWTTHGSPPAGTPYGDPGRAGGQRTSLSFTGVAMAGFGEALNAEEIVAVVHHERVALGGEDAEELAWMEEWIESPDFPESFADLPTDEGEAIAVLRELAAEFLAEGEGEVAAG
ncbi:MAG: c-type cytochrome [Acidimicrobiales bacterium]